MSRPARRFEAQDPRERMGGAVVVRIHKEAGRAAGIWLRHWKRGVIEVRGVMDDYPDHEREAIESHKGWLLVGVNNRPMYNVTEVGHELKRCHQAQLHLCPPNPGDIPAGKGAVAGPNRARSLPMPSARPLVAHPSQPTSVSPQRPAFKPGARVEVYYGPEDVEGGQWYPASVVSFHYDGTYSVLFDSGEACEGVAQHCMKHLGEAQAPGFPSPRGVGTFVGDRVEVYYGENDWFPGTIMSRQQDGSYTIRFDSGEVVPAVQPEFFRPLPEAQASMPMQRAPSMPMRSMQSMAMYNPDEPLHVGQTAEVLWEGKQWLECVVKAYHPEVDMYDVDWRDGSETLGVMAVHVRPAVRSTTSVSPRY
eukprot:TRINITY_DN22496_c0_g1_i1.p1 TRINITY_DN22496_c0_g1~~TRINITY_DN22496_c0_g1_i1.p1  ORF type:complete len:363 (+),score=140.98 TRINITY_DN22496_c0_g1_i1:52-1140(+)